MIDWRYFWQNTALSLTLDWKIWNPDTAISFVRFGALWKATKRTNAKMKFHFFVLATCITRQNKQTTKRNGRKTSFCRVVVLLFWRLVEVDKTNKRQNEQVTTTNQTLIFRGNFVILSFRRAEGAKTNKRENEISKFHFFVCSFCRVVQVAKTKKWVSYLRLFVLSPSPQHDGTTKRQSYREISKFDLSWLLVRFVVCSFCRLS